MFKIFKNKKTKYHPSIEIEEDEKNWKNLELTTSPREKDRYITLKVNPNPKDNKKSYVRKYVRNDPLRTKGKELKKYKLSENDYEQILRFLEEHNKNKKS